LLSKSLNGEEIAQELVQILSVSYGISSDYLIAAMRDRASVNSVAMKTVKIIYLNALDVGCFSYAWRTLQHTDSDRVHWKLAISFFT